MSAANWYYVGLWNGDREELERVIDQHFGTDAVGVIGDASPQITPGRYMTSTALQRLRDLQKDLSPRANKVFVAHLAEAVELLESLTAMWGEDDVPSIMELRTAPLQLSSAEADKFAEAKRIRVPRAGTPWLLEPTPETLEDAPEDPAEEPEEAPVSGGLESEPDPDLVFVEEFFRGWDPGEPAEKLYQEALAEVRSIRNWLISENGIWRVEYNRAHGMTPRVDWYETVASDTEEDVLRDMKSFVKTVNYVINGRSELVKVLSVRRASEDDLDELFAEVVREKGWLDGS